MISPRLRSKRLWAIVLLPLISTALSGCGSPSTTYAASKSEGVYFKVPKNWHRIGQSTLSDFEGKSTSQGAQDRLAAVKWQEAYSLDPKVGASAVFSLAASQAPIAYVRVRNLYPEERDAVSFNVLRDMIVPVTTLAVATGAQADGFVSLDDQEVVQKGGTGVHLLFKYNPAKFQEQVIDQTALTSADRGTIYLLVVRCSTICYEKNKAAIQAIASSFTVRGPRG